MIQALCLQKFRNKNNQIIGYKIQDKNGNTLDVKSEQLKQAIRNNQIKVLNLTLTSDNKLIDKAYKSQKPQKDNSKDIMSKDIMAKIKVIGTPITSPCGHTYYIIKKTDTTLVVIPNDVKQLNPLNLDCNTLKVIGGSGLESTHELFAKCKVKSIDLSNFDTSNVTDMSSMFEKCEVQSLDLSSFNTSNVTDMTEMFASCKAQFIDLSSFDTSNVTTMYGMFRWCEAQSIDLSSFNTSKVTDMYEMFWGCQAKSLDISSFDTSKVTVMIEMFGRCRAKILNISHFSTKSLTATADMFEGCEADYIDLGSFNLSRVLANNGTINAIVQEDEYEEIHSIFEHCNAEIRATDPKVLSEYKRRNKVRKRYY